MVDVNNINPFLAASTQILKSMLDIDAKIGKPALKSSSFGQDSFVIIIGITGQIKGQVMIAFSYAVALDLASKMMGRTVSEMNDMSMSAISELGNMILGNAATVFSNNGVNVDITTPTIASGNVVFHGDVPNVAIPLIYEESKVIEINVALR